MTRNVAADIKKILKIDNNRGGLAENTEMVKEGNSMELVEDGFEYYVYVIAEVKVLIDPANPYLSGK